MKRSNVILAVLLSAAIAAMMAGCATSKPAERAADQQATKMSSEESFSSSKAGSSSASSASSTAQAKLPGDVFYALKDYPATYSEEGVRLSSLSGDVVEVKIPTEQGKNKQRARFLGPLREGKVFAAWDNFNYDEATGNDGDHSFHIGCFDDKGDLLFTIDDIFTQEGFQLKQDQLDLIYVVNPIFFSEGKAVFSLPQPNNRQDRNLSFCVDSEGRLVWCLPDVEVYYPNVQRSQYMHGLITAIPRDYDAIPDPIILLDVNGRVVLNSTEGIANSLPEGAPTGYFYKKILGENMLLLTPAGPSENYNNIVATIDGTPLLVSGGSGEEIDGLRIKQIEDGDDGIVAVTVYMDSPSGNGQSTATGLLNVADKKWILEPSDTLRDVEFLGKGLIRYKSTDSSHPSRIINSAGKAITDSANDVAFTTIHYIDGDYWVSDNDGMFPLILKMNAGNPDVTVQIPLDDPLNIYKKAYDEHCEMFD